MTHLRWVLAALLLGCAATAWAGGPLLVGGPAVGNRPAFGVDGQAFTWDPAAMPIKYRVDPGPMAATATGTVVLDHTVGVQRLQSMFGVWQSVPTAKISFSNVGALLPAGAYTGGDLKTLAQYNAILGSCQAGGQSPVVFDADGTLISALGLPPEVIGFASQCDLDTTRGYVTAALVLLNGQMQDGINTTYASPHNYEVSPNQFDEAITHELGHLLGLDHSQINVDLYTQQTYPCNLDELAGLPLMFPIEMCQARKDAGLPLLAPDDVAWISSLYPSSSFAGAYGSLSGTIYFGDGVTPVQGVNVIARLVDDPNTAEDESRRVAVSAVSGYLFTGNPGQSVTADMADPQEHNTNGDPNGSRNPKLIGFYHIYVPPGTYTVEVEEIGGSFTAGSSLGPLDPPLPIPGPAEFWNQDESVFDFPLQRDTITVRAGDDITGIDVILNSLQPRFDQHEDSGRIFDAPLAPLLSRKSQVAA